MEITAKIHEEKRLHECHWMKEPLFVVLDPEQVAELKTMLKVAADLPEDKVIERLSGYLGMNVLHAEQVLIIK